VDLKERERKRETKEGTLFRLFLLLRVIYLYGSSLSSFSYTYHGNVARDKNSNKRMLCKILILSNQQNIFNYFIMLVVYYNYRYMFSYKNLLFKFF